MKATSNFKPSEFFCPHCGTEEMDQRFVEDLQCVRNILGRPVHLTSGYRCEQYQVELKKKGYETASGVSPHTKGVGADIRAISAKEKHELLLALACLEVGFNRFGIGSSFIHVDRDLDRNENRIWHYKR